MASRADGASSARRLVLTGLFAAAAMALSYAEHVLPVSAIIPVPGVRLGLSNVALIAAAVFISPGAGAAVAFMKITVPLLMSGNGIALLFSLCGTVLSYVTVLIMKAVMKDRVSFIGVCAASAGAHSAGQFLAALALIGKASAGYFPLMLLASVLTGIVTGVILNLCAPALGRLAEKYAERKSF